MIDDVKIFNKYVEKMNKYGWYLFYVPEANYDWRENYNNFQNVYDLFNTAINFHFDFWYNIMDTRNEFIRWWMNKELLCDVINFGVSPFPTTTLVLEDGKLDDCRRRFGDKWYKPTPHPGLKMMQIVKNLEIEDTTQMLLISKDKHSHGFKKIYEITNWDELRSKGLEFNKNMALPEYAASPSTTFLADFCIQEGEVNYGEDLNEIPRCEVHTPEIDPHPKSGEYGLTLCDMHHAESPLQTSKLFIDSLPFNIYIGCDDVNNPPTNLYEKIQLSLKYDTNGNVVEQSHFTLEDTFVFRGGGKNENWSTSLGRNQINDTLVEKKVEGGFLRFECNIIYIDKEEKYSIPNKNSYRGLSFYFEEDSDFTYEFDIKTGQYRSKSFLDRGIQNLFYFFHHDKTHFKSKNEKVIIFNCGHSIWKYTSSPNKEHFCILPKRFR